MPRRSSRSITHTGCLARTLLIAFVAAGSGCASVDPRTDFAQAAARAKERLGVEDVYDPTAESLIEQKVSALLADGLTVDEAVSVALINNRSFQALFQAIGASRAEVVQSGLLTNPSVTIGARFPEGGGRSELTLGLAQQLVDLWQIPVRKRVAEAELQQTIMSVLHEAVHIAAETRSRCHDLLWRERAEKLARENLEVATQSAAVAEARLRIGDATPLEAGLVRTKAHEAQDAVWVAQREREKAQSSLAQVLGLARSSRSWSLIDEPQHPSAEIPSDDGLLDLALKERFDVRIAGARVNAAADRVELELLRVFPSVEIGLNAERTERRALPGRKVLADTARASVAAGQLTAPSIESRGQRDLARRQIIDAILGPSVQLTLPIWDQNQAQIAKARSDLARAVKEQESLMDSVATELRRAATDARIARQRVQHFEATVLPQVETNLKSARSQYERGEESVVVLLEAQEEAFRQKGAALDARREDRQALTELQRAVGGRLPLTATSRPARVPDPKSQETSQDGNE